MRLQSAYWLLIALTAVYTANGQENADTLLISPYNTKIEFRAKHFGVINVSGTFKSFSGWIIMDNDIVTSAQITLKANSISTNNNSRDRSLKDDEFLDAQEHPFITVNFDDNSNPILIESQIMIKNVKGFVPLTYELGEKIEGIRKLKANCELSRKSFRLDLGSMDDLVSDKIAVSVLVTLKAN